MMDEWTTVTRKSRKKTKLFNCATNIGNINHDTNFTKLDLQAELDKVEKASNELTATGYSHRFFEDVKSVLNKYENDFQGHNMVIKELVCYGLGSVVNSYTARYQLAMLHLIWKFVSHRNDEKIPCFAYDPIFNNLDVAILKNYGIQVLQSNEEGRRKVENSSNEEISIFYMIHCDKFLYDNLLSENLKNKTLNRIMIIGNSMETMWERLPESVLKNEYKFLHKIISENLVFEKILSNWKENEEIFNDTSLHIFSSVV